MGPWHFSKHWGLALLLIYVTAERTNSSIQLESEIEIYHVYLSSLIANPLQGRKVSTTKDRSVTRHVNLLKLMTVWRPE